MTKVHSSKLVWFFCWVAICMIAIQQLFGLSKSINLLASWYGQSVEFEGVISQEPTQGKNSQIVTIKPNDSDQQIRASLYFPIVASKGDQVWVRGKLSAPENFSDFNYIGYLERHNVYAILKQSKIVVLKRASVSPFTLLQKFKKYLVRRATNSLNENSSSLVLGMLIGYRQSLPESIETSFKIAGLTHILAVSGFNMTIIASTFGVFSWLIGRRKADLVTLVFILLFTLITGMTAAVVRAAIMATLWVLARILGRLSYSYTALLLAITIMLVHNPLILFNDVGFQLSVVATIGVLEAHKLKTHFGKEGFWVEILWPTFGAILATVPVVAFHFKTLSTVAPLANAVVLPFVPILMLVGFLALLPIVKFLAIPIIEFLIAKEVWFVSWISAWQHASVAWSPSWQVVIFYYLVLAMLFRLIYQQNQAILSLKPEASYGKIKRIKL